MGSIQTMFPTESEAAGGAQWHRRQVPGMMLSALPSPALAQQRGALRLHQLPRQSVLISEASKGDAALIT